MEVPKRAQLASPGSPGFSPPDAGQRRFDMLAYTGGVVRDWCHPIVWDLAGMSASPGMVILKQHDPNKICATVDNAAKETAGLRLQGQLYKTPAAQEVIDLADQGFKWQASIGVENLEMDFLEPGDTRELNGIKHTGPMVIVTKSLVKESSFVPLGADGQTRSSVLADGGTITVKEKVKMSDKTTSTEPGPDLVQLERKRVADLSAAFPKDPGFVLTHVASGSSVLEAKAAYADVLQERLNKQQVLPEIPARSGGGQQTARPNASLEFKKGFQEFLRLSGLDRGRAMTQYIKDNSELHQQMLAEINGRPLDLSQRKGA